MCNKVLDWNQYIAWNFVDLIRKYFKLHRCLLSISFSAFIKNDHIGVINNNNNNKIVFVKRMKFLIGISFQSKWLGNLCTYRSRYISIDINNSYMYWIRTFACFSTLYVILSANQKAVSFVLFCVFSYFRLFSISWFRLIHFLSPFYFLFQNNHSICCCASSWNCEEKKKIILP